MEKIKPLGILLKDGKMVNHRSPLKIICNPILRVFGCNIVSNVDIDTSTFFNYDIRKCDRQFNIFKNYYSSIFTCNEYDEVKSWKKKKNINQ